jgi:hypothetical protein
MDELAAAEADQFALMLLAGAPPLHAVRYFLPAESVTEDQVVEAAETWPSSSLVLEAVRKYSGGTSWHTMTTSARLTLALEKHYNEMAYFLWTTSYVECDLQDRTKADTCRGALEVKVSGMAGQESPMARFYADMLARFDPPGPAS